VPYSPIQKLGFKIISQPTSTATTQIIIEDDRRIYAQNHEQQMIAMGKSYPRNVSRDDRGEELRADDKGVVIFSNERRKTMTLMKTVMA